METNEFTAHSCLDYLHHGQSKNGFYLLWDKDQRYLTYCDFASEPGSAWTLVMSWSFRNNKLPHFRSKTFMQDAPFNHGTPNWEMYRQTLAQMKSIRNQSTHWRATCWFNFLRNADTRFRYADYLRGKFSDFDIMTWSGSGVCQPVDYMNIGGYDSAYGGQTAQFWQAEDQYFLHTKTRQTKCDFKPPRYSFDDGKDLFGYYGKMGTSSRCTQEDDATTQWWFGGYLGEHWSKMEEDHSVDLRSLSVDN